MFLQFHALTSYPAALLNRDDAGFPKTMPFGGVTRTRISSQCLKRHWRTHEGEHSLHELDVPYSVRSRAVAQACIYQPMVDEGIDPKLAEGIASGLIVKLLGLKKAGLKDLHTDQPIVLGQAEVDYLLQAGFELAKKNPKDVGKAIEERLKAESDNMQALAIGSGLDAALFGRFITGDVLSNTDAAIHVAHAITVHEHAAESDYFSVVDDLASDEDHGASHINSVELTSGLYYSYVAVDVGLLISNLSGNSDLAREVVRRLVHIIATVSPGAKLGSTAPHAYASCMLAESGSAQPRTLSGSFERAILPRPDLLTASYEGLRDRIGELDAMYERTTERKVAGIGAVDLLKEAWGTAESLQTVADWAGSQIQA